MVFCGKYRKMRARLCFILLFIFITTRAGAIDAVVSHAVFYLHDSTQNNKLRPSVETYWEINPQKIHYSTNSEKEIIGRASAHIVFTTDSGFIKEDNFIIQTVPVKDPRQLGLHRITGLRRYFLTTGAIHMTFTLTDLADTSNKYSFTDTFTIPQPNSSVFYSSVQLLDTIIQSSAKTPYEKNGRQQVPFCTNFLDEPRQTLHYYGELYGADKVPKADYPLIQKIYIAHKPSEGPENNLIRKDTVKPEDLLAFSGDFDIRSLPSGNYYIVATVENNYHAPIATSSLFFQRLNTHPLEDTVRKAAIAKAVDTSMEEVNVLDLNKTFVAKYDLGQIRAILKMLLPFSDQEGTNTINGFLKSPQEIYMRYYIYNFFSSLNKKDPEQAWKEFSATIIAVNKKFNGHITPGYETDRGFMYLRYGPPTEVITVENEQGSLPYEIWQYNSLQQTNKKIITDAFFLFYKRTDMDEFRLLHSSVSGEVQNPAWRSYLYANGQGGNNGVSRAEQYIGK